MKRIEYENFETEYLRALGFLDEKGRPTKDFFNLNKEWESIRKTECVLSTYFPKNIKRLLTASYKKLIYYFIALQKLDKSSLNEIKKNLMKKTPKKYFDIAKFAIKLQISLKRMLIN